MYYLFLVGKPKDVIKKMNIFSDLAAIHVPYKYVFLLVMGLYRHIIIVMHF